MTVGIVDPLEIVDIEAQQRHHLLFALGHRECLRNPVEQQYAIGQSGQEIMRRELLRLLLGGLQLAFEVLQQAHIRDVHEEADDLAIDDMRRVGGEALTNRTGGRGNVAFKDLLAALQGAFMYGALSG